MHHIGATRKFRITVEGDVVYGSIIDYLNIRLELDGPIIKNHVDYIQERLPDVILPTTEKKWREWWPSRDSMRADALLDRQGMTLSDKIAKQSPKRFFQESTKGPSSSEMKALYTSTGLATSDEAIEEELTRYGKNLSSLPQAEQEKEDLALKARPHETYREDTKLAGLMRRIDIAEMVTYSMQAASSSAAGYDGISPALITAFLTQTWEGRDPKTREDRRREHLRRQEERYRTDPAYREAHERGERPPVPAGEDEDNTKEVIYSPRLTQTMLCRILNLCLETGDVPKSEKFGIITGLPKSDGGPLLHTDGGTQKTG